jgi:hypothetical protein
MRRLLLPAALALCALSPTSAVAQQPTAGEVLARVDRPTPIAAYGGRVVWSRRTAAGDAYQLMTAAGGVTSAVPVATRSVAFDVDLGPGVDGTPVAVYSRCAREGPVTNYLGGHGCDIYRFDFASGRETKVDEVSSPTASEAWPTVHRSRLAFARAYDDKRQYPYVYVKTLGDPHHGSVRMPGGPRRTCVRDRRTGRTMCTDATRSKPAELELYGRRLAFVWRFTDFAEGFAYDLRLDDVLARTGNPRRLVHQPGGGLTAIELGWPGFEAGRIYWSASCLGDSCPAGRGLFRSPYLGGVAPEAVDPGQDVVSQDRDGGATYVLRDTSGAGGVNGCRGDPEVPGGTCELARLMPAYTPGV